MGLLPSIWPLILSSRARGLEVSRFEEVKEEGMTSKVQEPGVAHIVRANAPPLMHVGPGRASKWVELGAAVEPRLWPYLGLAAPAFLSR